jgi:molecular chaperone GrpE
MSESDKKDPEPRSSQESGPEQAAGSGDSAAELDHLQQQLEKAEREAKDNYDRFLRQAAELENLRKRAAREKAEAIRFANESLIRDLLPVLDNLERAIEHARGGGNGKPLVDGVEMVRKGFLDILQKHGVTLVSAKIGEAFDPERHEALAQVEASQYEPNAVVEEHHKGYFLLDRLIRPALVSVAKPADTKKEGSVVETDESDD